MADPKLEQLRARIDALDEQLQTLLRGKLYEMEEERLAEEQTVSFYRQGEFIDLCEGPHVPSAGAIGAFKLLSVAGAYWKGDGLPAPSWNRG